MIRNRHRKELHVGNRMIRTDLTTGPGSSWFERNGDLIQKQDLTAEVPVPDQKNPGIRESPK